MSRLVRAVVDWLDDRAGIRALRHRWLDEPLPPGTGWWFTLGSVLLFGLTVQIVTGVALALFYAPTPDHAWDSVRYIDADVRAGRFLRGLHHWGASLVVIAAVLHLVRVVFFGSYRKPRELNWLVGLALLLVILAFGLTGYLLPWDQRAYWATVVTINIARLTPIAGEWVASLMRGGSEVGALTLTRWYAVHVLVLPALLVGLVVVHLYLMRRHGISGPVHPRAGEPKPFFPYQAARDLTVATIVGVLLAALAWRGAPALEAPADPTASGYIPRPDWYFLGLFQLLKYFPGKLEVIGALVLPGLALLALALMPWLDRSPSRAPRTRRALLSVFTAGLAAVVTLTILGARDRPPTPAEAWTVRDLAGTALLSGDRCARCHTADAVGGPLQPGRIARTADWLAVHVADPEVIAPGVRPPPDVDPHETAAILAALARLRQGPPPAVDAETQRVAVTLNRFCLGCHTIDGVGGTEGPDLSHVGQKADAAALERRIAKPTDVKPDAQMPAFGEKLSADEIRALARWLAARK